MKYILVHAFKTRMSYNCEMQARNLQTDLTVPRDDQINNFLIATHTFFPRFPHGSLSQEGQCVDQLESSNCTIKIYVSYSTAG